MTALALAAVAAAGSAEAAPPPLIGVRCDTLAAFAAAAVPLPSADAPDPGETDATRAALVALDRAMLALAATTTLLPVRFGAVFSDLGALQAAVASEARHWASLLDRAGGAREYHVEIAGAPEPAVGSPGADRQAASSGREFLSRRRDARNRRAGAQGARAAWCDDLEAALDPLVRARVWRTGSTRDRACLALLAMPGSVPALTAALAPFARPSAPDALVLSGPWPLYSFGGLHGGA